MKKLALFTVLFLSGWMLANVPAHAVQPELKEALQLDRQGFIGESIAAWQKFLATHPDKDLHIYAQIKLSIAYSKTGKFLEAAQAAQELDRIYPDHFDVKFNLGNMKAMIRHFDEAVPAYEAAVRLRPAEGLSYVGLGLSLFGQQKVDQSLEILRKVRDLFKQQKNISWYQNVRIMIPQIKSFAPYPPDFSNLWLSNNLKMVRTTYESTVFTQLENQLGL